MVLPRLDEYQLAIQNPKSAFKDPGLQSCKVELTPLGLPKVQSGGFALIYHLHDTRNHWAIRCFYREIGNLKIRYDSIGRFLERNANGTFVKATLRHEGIRVGGKFHPIIVMPWLVGDPLNLYIERNPSNRSALEWLPDAFLKIILELENLGVAHCDLQHGNIMVNNNRLTLIDYDGMYLRELANRPTKILGHINYIHPDRATVEYDPTVDRFPSLVIYLGLKAVVESPSLWRKYSSSENILFQRDDFLDPISSPLINDLKTISDLRSLAEKFQAVCFLNMNQIPRLADFISPSYVPPKAPQRIPPAVAVPVAKRIQYISQFEVVLADDTARLRSKVGEKLEVVGQITDFKHGYTRRNEPYMFLNFGDWRRKSFCLVLWSDVVDLFQSRGVRPESFAGTWVSVTGLITEYNTRPQLIVEMPSQIQKLSGKQEAILRIEQQLSKPQTTTKPPDQFDINKPLAFRRPTPYQAGPKTPQVTAGAISRRDAEALQRLYGGQRSASPAKTPQRLLSPRIASPKLFMFGVFGLGIALGLAIIGNAISIMFLILGATTGYLGALYRSHLVPISIQGSPFSARYPGRCRGCGRITPHDSIVKTERGYMHTRCAQESKKRIWRRR